MRTDDHSGHFIFPTVIATGSRGTDRNRYSWSCSCGYDASEYDWPTVESVREDIAEHRAQAEGQLMADRRAGLRPPKNKRGKGNGKPRSTQRIVRPGSE